MSWDVSLTDPVSRETIELDTPHFIRGGTYCINGTTELSLNITYNYGKIYREFIDPEDGLEWINNRTALETLPKLEAAYNNMKNDVDSDYWKATEGNAKRALAGLITFAKMRPDGIWNVS